MSASTGPPSVVDVSKPSASAAASRGSSRGVPRTCTPPPAARATCAASNPIGPGPITSTSSPSRTRSGSSNELQQQASGSAIAATLPSSQSGMRWRFATGTCRSGAKPPSTCVPIERRSGQRFVRPARQKAHTPHVEKYVSVTTRAPRQPPSTPSPSSATTPETSCPIVTGGTDGYSPSWMYRSVPQMPAPTTSSATLPTPGASFASPRTSIGRSGRARVDRGERQHDQAVQDLPRRLRRVQDRQERIEHRQDERAEDRPRIAAEAAEDGRPADHDRRHRGQQKRRRDSEIGGVVEADEQDPRRRRKRAACGIDE